jgi:hypothetical protein
MLSKFCSSDLKAEKICRDARIHWRAIYRTRFCLLIDSVSSWDPAASIYWVMTEQWSGKYVQRKCSGLLRDNIPALAWPNRLVSRERSVRIVGALNEMRIGHVQNMSENNCQFSQWNGVKERSSSGASSVERKLRFHFRWIIWTRACVSSSVVIWSLSTSTSWNQSTYGAAHPKPLLLCILTVLQISGHSGSYAF